MKQCLTAKPKHSKFDIRGWLLDLNGIDPDDREPCGAVGTVMPHWYEGGIVAVRFSVPSLLLPGEMLTTALYAHIEDLLLTSKPMSWPFVEGTEVR